MAAENPKDDAKFSDLIMNAQEILQYRKSMFRKDQNVCFITTALMKCVNVKTEEIIRDLTRAELPFFLRECEVYLEMSRERAMDAIIELTNLSTLFVNTPEYFQICEHLEKIRAAYPIPSDA